MFTSAQHHAALSASVNMGQTTAYENSVQVVPVHGAGQFVRQEVSQFVIRHLYRMSCVRELFDDGLFCPATMPDKTAKRRVLQRENLICIRKICRAAPPGAVCFISLRDYPFSNTFVIMEIYP